MSSIDSHLSAVTCLAAALPGSDSTAARTDPSLGFLSLSRDAFAVSAHPTCAEVAPNLTAIARSSSAAQTAAT